MFQRDLLSPETLSSGENGYEAEVMTERKRFLDSKDFEEGKVPSRRILRQRSCLWR